MSEFRREGQGLEVEGLIPAYDPGAVDYGQIPSDLIRDELKEMEFFRDFIGQFGGLFQDDDTKDAASEWLRVLTKYMAGEAELSELEAVDVSDLMGVEGFEDYYYETVPRPLTEDGDGGFFQSILDQMPDAMRDFIEDIGEDPAEVLKRILDTMPDIEDQLKQGQVGVEVIFGDWENSNVFGPFVIPGVPLPPGIIDITIKDIQDMVDKIGGTVGDFIDDLKNDPLGTIEGAIDSAGEWIQGVFNDIFDGTSDDPFGGTFGGFEDWVRGVFGNVIGGSILVSVYDSVSGFFDPNDGTLIVPGGAPVDDDEEERPKQGDDIADRPDRPDNALEYQDPFAGSFDDDDDDTVGGFEIGGVDISETDRDPVIPGGPIGPDPNEEVDPQDPPGSTDDGGGGGGVGGGGGGNFDPFMRGLSYVPIAPPSLVAVPKKDFVADITAKQQLDDFFSRNLGNSSSMFEGII